MKTSVIITLLVVGAFLIATPSLYDAWQSMLLAQVLSHGDNIKLWDGLVTGPYRSMSDPARFAFRLLGLVLIGIAIKSAVGSANRQGSPLAASAA